MTYATIGVPEPWATNLQEVFRHLSTRTDEEITNTNLYGTRTIVLSYVESHEEDFTEKEGNQYIFKRGDSSKSSELTAKTTEEVDNADESDDKWTFHMSDKEGE